jgi:hypothetical protein
VRVRYPAEYRQRLDLLPEVILKTPDGGQVPFSPARKSTDVSFGDGFTE